VVQSAHYQVIFLSLAGQTVPAPALAAVVVLV
jgi:hypothetical protein